MTHTERYIYIKYATQQFPVNDKGVIDLGVITNKLQQPVINLPVASYLHRPVSTPVQSAKPSVKAISPAETPSNGNDTKGSISETERFINYWREQENASKAGYDKKRNLWFPHVSPEGGALTVGYGLKLNDRNLLAEAQKGITEERMQQLLNNARTRGYSRIKSDIDGKYGVGTYDRIPERLKYALLDIHMNTGNAMAKFPAFTDHVVNNNRDGMLKEYHRSYLPEGSKDGKLVRLDRRNNAFYNTFLSE